MNKSNSDQIVVFIHGWPVTPYHWRFLGPMMEDAGYQVKYITPRGLGIVDHSNRPYEKAIIASEILEQLDSANINEFSIIGHDWGGTIGYLIAKEAGPRCWGLIIEEEILPGIQVNIPEPGSMYYPQWHGPFNRSVGLGESLIPGNERTYYGKFLEESFGKDRISKDSLEEYLSAYSNETQLKSTLGYYRTGEVDQKDIKENSRIKIDIPILAIGGLFGMGGAVGEAMEHVGSNVTSIILQNSGHYPAEQEPKEFANKARTFLQNIL